VRDETGPKLRRLESEQCTDLAHAAALALALLLKEAAAGKGNSPGAHPNAAAVPPAPVPTPRPAAMPPLREPYVVNTAQSVQETPPVLLRLASSR
jgi:hypothetical protein